MDNYFDLHNFCLCTGGKIILSKKYILYGFGVTNQAVKKFFDKNKVEYLIYVDDRQDSPPTDRILNHIDYIVKCPGIKFDTSFLNKCYEHKIKVLSDLELMYLFYKEYEYIIITGSNGKTTTAYLTYQMLNHLPLFKDGLGGNIGIPLFSLLLEKRPNRGVIIEASSFMLHNTFEITPKIYVITNLVPHHLDYHGTIDNYYDDKMKIISNLEENDYLIYNYDDVYLRNSINNFKKPIKLAFSYKCSDTNCYISDNYIYYQNEKIISIEKLRKREIPVLYDMMVAIIIAKIYHIPHVHIEEVLKNFEGLEYRFQKIYDNNGLIIINDSKATSPSATVYAIRTVNENYQLFYKTLIIGGKMVDDNYDILNREIKGIDEIHIYGSSRYEILSKINHSKIFYSVTLEEVVSKINFKGNQIILFSPSCVSYDQFESYIKRGQKFNTLIKDIIDKKNYTQKMV